MIVRDYNRIMDSLSMKLSQAQIQQVVRPVSIQGIYDVTNTLITPNSKECKIYFYKDGVRVPVEEGQILFIPEGQFVPITYGEAGESEPISNEQFISNKSDYLKTSETLPIGREGQTNEKYGSFSSVKFQVKIFESVNFFASLDIHPFLIKDNRIPVDIMNKIVAENYTKAEGSTRMMNILTDELILEIVRHILNNELFVEKLATNSNYFRDIRLINILKYIKANLSKDLSNKVLAKVAKVSEDYVGQYFKMLTGINPQDYIEYQRMEKAVKLLRASKKSIREIGTEVGFKDTAYFCRRFKMMFGIPAGKMRRRESLAEEVMD